MFNIIMLYLEYLIVYIKVYSIYSTHDLDLVVDWFQKPCGQVDCLRSLVWWPHCLTMLLTNAWKAVERAKVDIHMSKYIKWKKKVIIYRAWFNSNTNKLYNFLVAISAMSTLWKQQESDFFGQFSSHTDEGICILRNQTNGGMCFLCCWLCTRLG